MEKRFVVPAVSFLAPFFIWVAFFILVIAGNKLGEQLPWLGVALSLIVGGLILFSAVSCQRAGGPRVGSIARGIGLLLLAAAAFWKVGMVSGCVLAVAAIAAGSRYFGSCPGGKP